MILVTDYLNPDFENCFKVHDWKNYVTADLISIWNTFEDYQKQTIAEALQSIADDEEWD